MKKWLLALVSIMLVAVVAACGNKADNSNAASGTDSNGAVTLRVGATAVPHAEILNHLKPELAKEGVNLDVVEFTDYIQPNVQLNDKKLDANYFQTKPYLDEQNKSRGMNLVIVQGVHIEPFGGYSKKYTSLDQLPEGATIAIPNEVSNGARALILLANNGLIELKDKTNITSTTKDITSNPKNLQFKEMDAAMLTRQLDQVDMAMINMNYVLEAKIDPKSALVVEDSSAPYANYLVAREDNKDSEAIQKLAKALTSDDTKKFIEEQYKGAVIPAF
ncbi:MetQ/NlpA family ABC transporter substrate-binding protein [Paenibacillus hunanensis]|uniref:Lipoprotein n=1 Tax=Paenibacillus hunanensis TaxID=539262 RepID=A0ABU1IWX0_9BACL|nr:MetQ/NlpA family ABC transporter substrate-binding protein [Paenibacillus hunanensis]MDR6243752.1 D-methionine transport system substrate-binding protein [Paenibacillus hunanensis]WPP42329.1 MetQ/NlpA family ABC transporter substrate-binding protein [Paenibacillus hunanensis]GGJ24498.1 methionine ABC transporter substrate-binding protein [Paenibacillus hunanensis]